MLVALQVNPTQLPLHGEGHPGYFLAGDPRGRRVSVAQCAFCDTLSALTNQVKNARASRREKASNRSDWIQPIGTGGSAGR